MNCLHVLAAHGRENAHLIFDSILKHHQSFPLDVQDGQGNTGGFFFPSLTYLNNIHFINIALLLAYKSGHGQLCRALVTAGANLSLCNNDSLSIFTMPAASKALLVNILGMLLSSLIN